MVQNMNYKIVCQRGDTCFLVKREEDYCLVDLLNGTFRVHENPLVFLKHGYFEEVEQVAPEVTEAVEKVLSNPDNQARL